MFLTGAVAMERDEVLQILENKLDVASHSDPADEARKNRQKRLM